MADNGTAASGPTIGWDEVGGVAFQRILNFDPETGLNQGGTALRDRLVAQRCTVLADSVADGLAYWWTTTVANGGTASLSGGEVLLQTSTATNGSVQIVSPIVPYHPFQVNALNSAIRFGDTGTAGNIRRIGAFTVSGTTPQDGWAYELDGTSLYAATYKAGTPTRTLVSAWSRFADDPFTLTTDYVQLELRWTSNRADFVVNNTTRHIATGGSTILSGTLSLPICLQNIKTAGANNIVLALRNVGIGRFGAPETVKPHIDAQGRTTIQFWATGVASGATGVETAITLNRSISPGAATVAAASYAPTLGKKFRILSMQFAARGHNTATAQVTTFSVRVNTAGALATTSNQVLAVRVATPATANAWDRYIAGQYDHGIIEVDGNGTINIGVTANSVFVTNAPTWDVLITAVEYAP